jgi:hypothetical protein
MTSCLKDQNCFKPQDSQIVKQISEPKEIGLYTSVQTHIKIRWYEIRICHYESRGQWVQTPLGRNFARFWIQNLCLGVNKFRFCATSTTCCFVPDHLQHLLRKCFAGCRPLTSSRLLPIVECDDINPLNAKLNPICHFLALVGAHPIFHVSRIKVKLQSGSAKKFRSETQTKVLVVSVDQVARIPSP